MRPIGSISPGAVAWLGPRSGCRHFTRKVQSGNASDFRDDSHMYRLLSSRRLRSRYQIPESLKMKNSGSGRCRLSSGCGGRGNIQTSPLRSGRVVSAPHAVKSRARTSVALSRYLRHDTPDRARRSSFKNFCAGRRRNTPKRNRIRRRCQYCIDKAAGVHWRKRNKKGCARLATTATPISPRESRVRSRPFFAQPPPSHGRCLHASRCEASTRLICG